MTDDEALREARVLVGTSKSPNGEVIVAVSVVLTPAEVQGLRDVWEKTPETWAREAVADDLENLHEEADLEPDGSPSIDPER